MKVASDRSDRYVYNIFLVMYDRNYKPLKFWVDVILFIFKKKLLKEPICNFLVSFNPA